MYKFQGHLFKERNERKQFQIAMKNDRKELNLGNDNAIKMQAVPRKVLISCENFLQSKCNMC